MMVEEADISALAPPKKKLKQARLPFQLLSPSGGATPPEKSSKKRKLSEGSQDDIKVVKVVKPNGIDPSVESKENRHVPIEESKNKTEDDEVEVIDLEKDEEAESEVCHSYKTNQTSGSENGQISVKDSCGETRKKDASQIQKNLSHAQDKPVKHTPSVDTKNEAETKSKCKKVVVSGKESTAVMKSVKGDVRKLEKNVEAPVDSSDSTTNDGSPNHSVKIGKALKTKPCGIPKKRRSVTKSKPKSKSNKLEKTADSDKKEPTVVLENVQNDAVNSENGTEAQADSSSNSDAKNSSSNNSVKLETTPQRKSSVAPKKRASTNKPKTEPKNSKLILVTDNTNNDSFKDLATPLKNSETCDGESLPSTPGDQSPITENKEESSSDEQEMNQDNSSVSSSDKSLNTPQQETSATNSARKSKKLTPKQLSKQMESAKKKEEKEKLRQEREKKRQEEKEEKQRQKIEEKQKKIEEKEKKRLAELEAQRLKNEQKQKEKEEKERKKAAELEQKSEEKRKKEEIRLEEKRKKEEKRLAEEEAKKKEEELKRKEAAAFTSFFRTVKTDSKFVEEVKIVENFMPFEIKADMRLAPAVRSKFDNCRREALEHALDKQEEKTLYLEWLKQNTYTPGTCGPTWPLSELRDEIQILDDDDDDDMGSAGNNVVIDRHPLNNVPRPKLLQFWDNRRPPYWGTWRKKSPFVGPRTPFGKDDKLFDYEVDSDDEWEEEEPGESLHGSDDEKESEDEYEVDNDFFVPHGYLSEEENEHEEDEKVSPETLKAKLKLLEIEFQEEMKQKTECIKPRVIGCIWLNNNTDAVSARLRQLLNSHRAVFCNGPIVTSISESDTAENSPSKENTPGPKKRKFPEEATPALLKLIHGNVNGRVFLIKEFLAYLKKELGSKSNTATSEEGEQETANQEESAGSPNHTGISKMSIAKKIKELSSWIPCPEEGIMQGRSCWYVPAEIRTEYGLEELTVPNKVWNYFHTPKVSVVVPPVPANEVVDKPLVIDEKPSKPAPLITKFTKKMTSEELQKQLVHSPGSAMKRPPMKKIHPLSGGKIQKKLVSSKPNSSPKDQPRRKIPILMSVSVGQEIPKSQLGFKKSDPSTSSAPAISESKSDNKIECVTLD